MSQVGSHNRRIETEELRRVAKAAAHYIETGELDRLAALDQAVRSWQRWRQTATNQRHAARRDSHT